MEPHRLAELLCLGYHQAIAARPLENPKDDEFCRATVVHRLIDRPELEHRLATMTLAPPVRALVEGRIAAHFAPRG